MLCLNKQKLLRKKTCIYHKFTILLINNECVCPHRVTDIANQIHRFLRLNFYCKTKLIDTFCTGIIF